MWRLIINIVMSMILVLLTSQISTAQVIFQEDYDSVVAPWDCTDDPITGWTGGVGCDSDTVSEVTHYSGEITTGGITGNSLKMWRHDGSWANNYSGYMNRYFTSDEFANHYKELFVRYYMKVPSDWDVDGSTGSTSKLSRFFIGKTSGADTTVIYWDVKGTGGSWQTGRFSIYVVLDVGGISIYETDELDTLGILDNDWHCYELNVKLNTSTGSEDGEIHLYIDGEQTRLRVGKYPDVWSDVGVVNGDFGYEADDYFTSPILPGIGNLTEGSYNFPDANWRAIEFDNLVVSTGYIGPISSSTANAHSQGCGVVGVGVR